MKIHSNFLMILTSNNLYKRLLVIYLNETNGE